MTVRHVVVQALLWSGVALNLIAAIGVMAMRDSYDRLHFPGVAMLGAVLVAISVVVEKSFSLLGDEALLIAAFLLLAAPVLTHATARAIRVAQLGDWRLQEQEEVEVEEP